MKKGLKIGLTIGGSLLIAGGAWAGLTKAGVIPNWFEIEALCPNKSYTVEDQNITNDDIYMINNYNFQDSNNGFSNNGLEEFGESFGNSAFGYQDKPIIYLYPTIETKVNVKLGTPKNLSHTYPKYNHEKGWNVIAQPNGELKDTDTGRKLYALYREGKSDIETNFDEGFVVEGKDIIPFLEEKLAILGLNEREAEEFIVYWLPQMEDNVWNLIRFETKAEQDENMPLNITPKPNTVIRVMMDWKAINEPIDIPEQKLTTPERNGFTVVERGGSPRN